MDVVVRVAQYCKNNALGNCTVCLEFDGQGFSSESDKLFQLLERQCYVAFKSLRRLCGLFYAFKEIMDAINKFKYIEQIPLLYSSQIILK